MSTGVGSYATTATVYGRNPVDSYYNLSAPGLINGPLEVTGNLKVDGSTELVGPVVARSTVAVEGNTSVAGSVTVTQTQGGGTPGLVVTNAGAGGTLRSVSVFNDQSSPGTLINMQNGADAGTIAYSGSQFTLSRPLSIPVQAGSLGNLVVGGATTLLGAGGGNALVVGQNGAARDMVVTGTSFLNTVTANSVQSATGYYGADATTRAALPAGLLTPGATISGGGASGSLLLMGDAARPGGAIVGYNGVSATLPPNFPFGLLINGQPLSTGITASTTAGVNNSWWVKFSPPGSAYSFALVGGSGAFSGGVDGGMTIFGPPFTSVITAVGSSVKGTNILVTFDPAGVNPANGEIKFFAAPVTGGQPVGPGAPIEGIAMVLITN